MSTFLDEVFGLWASASLQLVKITGHCCWVYVSCLRGSARHFHGTGQERQRAEMSVVFGLGIQCLTAGFPLFRRVELSVFATRFRLILNRTHCPLMTPLRPRAV